MNSPEIGRESGNEEAIFRNFDEEAEKIVEVDTLPKKSGNRYILVFDTFKKWQAGHAKFLSSSLENNLIVYFKELIDVKKFKAFTVWCVWSMLRKTFNTKENIDINRFQNLKSIVKKHAEGYKPKKSLVFTWENVWKYLNDAPDFVYLASKVGSYFYLNKVKCHLIFICLSLNYRFCLYLVFVVPCVMMSWLSFVFKTLKQ